MSTWTPISTQTLTSTATSVTFSGIPQTYTDLVVIANVRGDAVNTNTMLRFNSDTATNYSITGMSGEGASPISYRNTSVAQIALNSGSANWNNVWGNFIIHIMNYTNTTTAKTIICRGNAATGETTAHVGLWRKSPFEAINTLNFVATSGTWSIGSTFTLYGIGAGSPKAFGGDEVRTDGTYWYHIYRSSGIFSPMTALTCDYLVVAGGASSGYSSYSGGGGAGGLRSTVTATGGGGSLESALSLTSGNNYTVTVGAGGAAIASAGSKGNNGSNSVFSTITSTGGGGGGSYGVSSSYWNGASGGSGGGGSSDTGTGGSRTTNEGYIGGNANANGGGGGGGSGGAGTSYTSGSTGLTVSGGSGVAVSITGSSVTYAAGGKGRSNGADAKADGAANTGNGGGGATSASGAGGSGIVVVRYAI